MSSFIDQRGRIFGKVSLVDIVVVLAVIALILLAFVRFAKPAVAQVPVITTLAIERVRDPTVEQLEVGDEVRDEGGASLGAIEAIEIVPTPIDIPRTFMSGDSDPAPEEAIVVGESKVYKDVELTVRGSGEVSDGGIVVNGVVLAVGKPLVIYGNGFQIRTTVQHVEVVGG